MQTQQAEKKPDGASAEANGGSRSLERVVRPDGSFEGSRYDCNAREGCSPENDYCWQCGKLLPEPARRAGAGSMQPVGRRIHTIPIGDKELHAAQETCWCHPTQTEPNVIVHNALDCSEAQERATGAKASEGWVLIAEYVFPDSPTYGAMPPPKL